MLPDTDRPALTVRGHLRLHSVPKFARNDSFVQSRIPELAMANLSDIKAVLQQIIKCAPGESGAAASGTVPGFPYLASDVGTVELVFEPRNASQFQIKSEDLPYE